MTRNRFLLTPHFIRGYSHIVPAGLSGIFLIFNLNFYSLFIVIDFSLNLIFQSIAGQARNDRFLFSLSPFTFRPSPNFLKNLRIRLSQERFLVMTKFFFTIFYSFCMRYYFLIFDNQKSGLNYSAKADNKKTTGNNREK